MNKGQTGMNQGVKMFFGFFMVLVYIGMAALMAVNFFDFPNTPTWTALRWFFAVILFAYGIYRGYREVNGEHTYGMRRYDDPEEDSGYTTYSKSLDDTEKENK